MHKLQRWRDVWQYGVALLWRCLRMEGESDGDSKRKREERDLKWVQITLNNLVSPKQLGSHYYPSFPA